MRESVDLSLRLAPRVCAALLVFNVVGGCSAESGDAVRPTGNGGGAGTGGNGGVSGAAASGGVAGSGGSGGVAGSGGSGGIAGSGGSGGVAGSGGSGGVAGSGGSGGVAGSGGSGGVAGASGSGGVAGSGGSGGVVGAGGSGGVAGAGGSGGVAGAGGRGGAAGTSVDSGVAGCTLVWRDDFDTFDTSRWQKNSHTFAENASQFAPENAVVKNGLLVLSITPNPGAAKPFKGAEVATLDSWQYGLIEARVHFAGKGSGIISSLFTWFVGPASQWNEIDVEYLGRYTNAMSFTTIAADASGQKSSAGFIRQPLTWQPSADFHVYAIHWAPAAIKFYADGVELWSTTQHAAIMNRSQTIRMNIWPAASSIAGWAGALDTAAAGTAIAEYDWVQYSRCN
jgi:endo-1,3-1,4-beta-glycanase ExoK